MIGDSVSVVWMTDLASYLLVVAKKQNAENFSETLLNFPLLRSGQGMIYEEIFHTILSDYSSVTWQQNLAEYWWDGSTSTAIPSTSKSDIIDQNKTKNQEALLLDMSSNLKYRSDLNRMYSNICLECK